MILSVGGVEPESSTKVREAVKLGTNQLISSLEGGKVSTRSETRNRVVTLTKDIVGEVVMERLVEQSEERSLEVKNYEDNDKAINGDGSVNDSLLSSVHEEVKEFSERYIESLSRANQSAIRCANLREELENNMNTTSHDIEEVKRNVTLSHLRNSIETLKAELSKVEDLKKNPIVIESNLIKELKESLCEKISFLIHSKPLEKLDEKIDELGKIYSDLPALTEELKQTLSSITSAPSSQLESLRLAPTAALPSVLVKGRESYSYD